MGEIAVLIVAIVVGSLVTPFVAWFMRRCRILDRPESEDRKIHQKPLPLGGGLAIYITFFGLIVLGQVSGIIFFHTITFGSLFGMFASATIIMIGGLLDDRYNLKPRQQIWFPVLASLTILAFGIGPTIITNPFGGVLDFSHFFWLLDIMLFFWLMGMMFTTKFLDGLDGLVAGVVAIGALVIFFLTKQPAWYQPEVGFMALVLAGSCLGFLIWNFYPAKIFLGEGGSLLTGFLLGVLAIISGSKIITTLLVMGIPALDVARVIYHRFKNKRPIFVGDNEHLHFKLVNAGLTQPQAVLLFYGISLVFGLSALTLSNHYKLLALVVLAGVMAGLGTYLSYRQRRHLWKK